MSRPADYTVISQVHENQWVPALRRAVPGWEVVIRDTVTGTYIPLFIDDEHWTAEAIPIFAAPQLAIVRANAAAGTAAAPPPTAA